MSAATLNVALVGNPNCGKTALFNRLTGSRQKVANYAGVTVERKSGRLALDDGRSATIIDLPGTYSLAATSPDEAITRDYCLGRIAGEAPPDLLVCVVDATNLRLHLRFLLEVRALGMPMLVALNMVDAAARRGLVIDRNRLAEELGLPIVETVAIRGKGLDALRTAISAALPVPSPRPAPADLHAEVRRLLALAVTQPARDTGLEDAIDRWALHPVLGLAALAAVMFLVFQAVFSWAAPLQDGIDAGIAALADTLNAALPEGALRSLLVDGIVVGTGSVVIFLPQILLLFLFILVLEESGYLPRAAFLLDRLMVGAGLTGRSFIPLLSSFACAVPGIMAARSIQDPRDRLATILVAPLMTCSARLPVYTLLIGAFIPEQTVAGLFNLQGLVLFALYAAGIVSALLVAYVMKWLRRGTVEHALLLELPAYRLPNPRDVALGLWERALIFLRRVGGIILSLSVLLWFLTSYPAAPASFDGPAIDYSFAGRLGHAIEPLFAPIGFNWQISVALIPGLAAREVAVSALATVYAISATDDDAAAGQLLQLIAAQWSLATALALLAWFVFAPQCISTLAVIRRETNSWKTTAFAAGYLFALAWGVAWLTYAIASAAT